MRTKIYKKCCSDLSTNSFRVGDMVVISKEKMRQHFAAGMGSVTEVSQESITITLDKYELIMNLVFFNFNF